MNKPLHILLLLTTTLFWSCKQDTAIAETAYEQEVFYTIFPLVVDTLYYDIRLFPTPPPPSPEYLEAQGYNLKKEGYKNAVAQWKESNNYKKQLNDWQARKDSIERDTTPIYILVQDSVFFSQQLDITYLSKHFDNVVIEAGSTDIPLPFKMEIPQLKTNHNKLTFKYRSDLPNDRDLWPTKYKQDSKAYISLTHVLLDKSKTYGVLQGSYVISPLNGSGFTIYIRKTKDGNWVIDKIVGTWVS